MIYGISRLANIPPIMLILLAEIFGFMSPPRAHEVKKAQIAACHAYIYLFSRVMNWRSSICAVSPRLSHFRKRITL